MEDMAKIAARLGKLRRNEELMTEAQKGAFKNQLHEFKKLLFADCMKWLEWYLNTAVEPLGGDSDSEAFLEMKKRTQEIITFGIEKKWIHGLRKVLFETYSLDEMLKAASPWQDRLRFYAYAPYWCSHCHRVMLPGSSDWLNPSDGDREFWKNDIIGMIWDEESGMWINSEGYIAKWQLPPTLEKCEELRKKEYEELRKKGMTA